jgi:hypothetical protein
MKDFRGRSRKGVPTMVTACPKCGYSNNGIDRKCANCDRTLPENDGPAVRPKIRFNTTFLYGYFALLVIISTVFYIFWSINGKEMPLPETVASDIVDPVLAAEDHSDMAYVMMCDYMRERCRAPGTAVFPPLGEKFTRAAKTDGTTYLVLGYVDYEGEAGKTVRRFFKGEIFQVGLGSWKLLTYELDRWDSMGRYFSAWYTGE